MKKFKCIVVDYNQTDANLLGYYIDITPFLRFKHTCSTIEQAIELINRQTIELIYLDSSLSGLNNDTISQLSEKAMSIILTSNSDTSLPIDDKIIHPVHLVKPISYEMFLKTSVQAVL